MSIMKAGEKALAELIEGTLKEFVIPVFQRRYDWRKEQCQRLWNDLVNVVNAGFRQHFFGSIVSVINHEPKKIEYMIIDGQQRITTVSLLLAAICNLAHDKELGDPKGLAPLIFQSYLIDKFKDDDNTRLRLNKQDYDAYYRIVNNDLSDPIEPCNVLFNYEFFVEQIKMNKNQITISDLHQAIRHLSIVDIQLKQGEDDPQLIFESLNSTGLALSEADKIRNLVLMNLPYQTQKDYYNKYWQKIESHVAHNQMTVSDFARDYLTIILRRTPRADQVYAEFKNYYLQTGPETEKVLSEMLKYSRYYQIIVTAKHDDPNTTKALKALQRLENKVTYPYLMELLDNVEEQIISVDSLTRVLRLIENFLFRRTICSVPTNALNKLFTILEKDVRRHHQWKSQYEAVFSYVLMNKLSSSRFPRDDEFQQALLTRDIYNMHARSKVYLLEELENFGTKNVVDVSGLIAEHMLTIEHIMPQTLTPAWSKSLEPNAEETHVRWLHTLGNLTLTAYNGEYSNRSYQEKKDMHNGFKESKLMLNDFVVQCSQWTEIEIEQRAAKLANIALSRWPMLESTFAPSKPAAETITLFDDESFTFKQIQSFEFKGLEKPAESWTTLYQHVMKTLFEKDPSLMTAIIKEPELYPALKSILSFNKQVLRMALHIGDSIYAESNLDTNRKMQAIRDLMDIYGEDISGLTITLKSSHTIEMESDDTIMVDNNVSRGITVEQWKELLQDKAVFRSPNLKMLLALYEQPDKKLIFKMLADQLGLNVSGLNGQVISLGKRIVNRTGIPRRIRIDGSERFWNICFMGEKIEQSFALIIRPELIQAIDEMELDPIQSWIDKVGYSNLGESEKRNLEFWEQLLKCLYSQTSIFSPHEPSTDSWINFGSGLSDLHYGTAITQKDCTAFFIMERSDKVQNKAAFDFLQSSKSEIESTFGHELEWSRLDDKISCIITIRLLPFDIRNESQWPVAKEFLVRNLIQMHSTMNPLIPQIRSVLNL